jgi:hypothetical protein
MLMLETAQEFFSKKREKELRERREADRQQLLRWERLQLGKIVLYIYTPNIFLYQTYYFYFTVKMQRAQGIVSRSTSVAATPMVPTPMQTPSISSVALILTAPSPDPIKSSAVLSASSTVNVPPLSLSGGVGGEGAGLLFSPSVLCLLFLIKVFSCERSNTRCRSSYGRTKGRVYVRQNQSGTKEVLGVGCGILCDWVK